MRQESGTRVGGSHTGSAVLVSVLAAR